MKNHAFTLIRPLCSAAAGLSVAAGGCSSSLNPFAANDSDYAQRAALARLKEVSPATIDAYRKPVPAPNDAPGAGQPDAAARVAQLKQQFAALKSMDLGIEDARASALANNLDLKVAFIDPAIAREGVSLEEARFESAFTLQTTYNDSDSPTASTLSSNQSTFLAVEPGVSIPTRTGGTVTVSLPFQRSETDNAFSTLNPAYAQDVAFSLSHPLLRNAGRRVATSSLRIAGYNEQTAEARTKLDVIRQIAAADRAYWDLYQVRQELDVSQQQFELAQAQLERARRRVQAGLESEVEVVRAEAGVAARLEAIVVAQNSVLLRQRELKRIINLPGLSVDTATVIVPATAPDPVEYVFEPAQLVGRALDNRMELLELSLQLAADAVQQGFDRNQLLPLVDLTYSYRFNGLGVSHDDAIDQMLDTDFPDWTLSLNAQVPLGNEAARSQLRQTILRRIARMGTREARELVIRQEVLNAVDAINSGWQRILAARQNVIANTRSLQAEQKQYDVGRRTTDDVLDAATRLAIAQLSEVRALADYQVAQVDLAFATGTLLGASKVSWEPAPSPDINQPDPPEELPERLKEPVAKNP